MSVKLYYDFISQPSRALYIFLKKCKIPLELKFVSLVKGEHRKPEYAKINFLKKVPAIDHNGFTLAESVGIFRYLCREFQVENHWYPKDSQARAKVDEFLEWQHLNLRLNCTAYFRAKYMIPAITGKPAKSDKLFSLEAPMMESLDQIEQYWLKNKPFLTGNKISVADLVGACEVEQPRFADYDPREGRPNLTAWLNRVYKETTPYYDEAHELLNATAKNYEQHQ